RAPAGFAMDGPVRQRPDRRPRLGRAHAQLLRHGPPIPARRLATVVGRRALEGRTRGMHEITLDADAHAILLTAEYQPTIRRAADGRSPELTVSDLSLARVTQVHAPDAAPTQVSGSGSTSPPALTAPELSVLLAWSEA